MNCCLQPIETKNTSRAQIKAHLSIKSKNKAKIIASATVLANNTNLCSIARKIEGSATINAPLSSRLALSSDLICRGKVRPHLSQIFNMDTQMVGVGSIQAPAAKFAGSFRPNDGYDKLYPSEDLNKLNLVGVAGNTVVYENLYQLVNEGVYTGPYHLHNEQSDSVFSWSDYIKSSGSAENTAYSTKLSLPAVSFTESFVVFNAQASYAKQRIYDIEFRDEENNLICKYEDIEFVGDNAPTMYSSKPLINNGAEYTWSAKYPKIPSSGCTLSFKTQASCVDGADAFNNGFDKGFEKCSALYDPEIRISAIEICNSGDFGFRYQGFLPTYVGVRQRGDRLERHIKPTKVLPYNFNTDVWPEVQTVWENTYGYSNLTEPEGRVLALDISKPYDHSNITLKSSTIQDSGKLHLLFERQPERYVFGFREGAFGIGFNSSEFDVAEPFKQKDQDDFFVVDEIYLKVRAKKAQGSRDYALDVVGWSDDSLLNITSQTGGFLQNVSGVGTVPSVSGWNNLDQEGISSESMSENEEYYENEAGSDHYRLSPSIVSSITYMDYEIPLAIEIDEFKLGLQDFSSSSFLEKLYLDIYPLPSGASISSLELCVKYTPSNALHFTTLAGDVGRVTSDRSEARLFPTTRQATDVIVNTGSGYVDLLPIVSSIPYGYESDAVKSNYTRRWRGAEGLVSGPFNPNQFDFGFENPHLRSPFLLGEYKFDNIDGSYVYPSVNSGTRIQHQDSISDSFIGARFQSGKSIAFMNNMADSFERYLDVNGKIFTVENSDHANYSIYLRFSPASNIVVDEENALLDKPGEFVLRFYKRSSGYEFTLSDYTGIQSLYSITNDEVIFPISIILVKTNANYTLHVLKEKGGTVDTVVSVREVKFSSNRLRIGRTSLASKVYVHELGFSNSANLVNGNIETPDLLLKQQTAQSYLKALHMHWWQPGQSHTADTCVLPNYINENSSDWHLGAYNQEFVPHEYDTFTKRIGRNYLRFDLICDGVAYSEKTDIDLPSTINPNVSYHTQLENDFLRLNLTDTADNFYATDSRISKTLPRGYDFKTDAIVVDTVIDYAQSGVIVWPDGNVGPKLIVSLYTPTQEDAEIGTKNWGIVNRKVHYLNPNTKWLKLESGFDLESLLDESEAWAVFPKERRLTEFNHKYFSNDIDQMFLQYDLVTPSGGKFGISLNIHSANVRLENALVSPSLASQSLNVYTSGEQYSYSPLNLFVEPIGLELEYLNLHLSGVPTPVDLSSIELHTSGANISAEPLNLYTINKEQLVNSLDIYTSGNFRVESDMGLVLYNDQTTFPSDMLLPLHMYGTAVNPDLSRRLGLVAYSSLGENQAAIVSSMPMRMLASKGLQDVFSNNSLNLFIDTPTRFGEDMNLFLFGRENDALKTESFLNLYSKCFPAVYLNGSGDSSISWNSRNFGRNTEEIDEPVLRVPSTDIIRGVQTICWGDCSNLEDKCVEQSIVTHDTDWSDQNCVEGGILRPSRTYTNSGVFAFDNEDAGTYNGHFYGSRKYQGLFPNTPYTVSVIGKAGSKESIALPPKWEEWEYGTLGDIDFEGFKFVGPERNANDRYGHCVRVKDNLMGVGAPGHALGVYEDAGAIFLYRRQQGQGGEKKFWDLEKKLTLPSGFIGDWYYDRGGSISFPGIGTIPEKQWNIGQEGRELGHSFDIAITNDREVIIAGGPGAKWNTRSFEEIETSGVNVAIMVFNNEFEYTRDQVDEVMKNLDIHNFLYKYFAQPAVNINLKIISCIPTGIFDNEVYTEPGIDNLVIKTIPRSIPSRPENPATTAAMLSGIKEAFFDAFPYDDTKVNNNIPPIVGFYVDNSRSLGRPYVEPAIDQFVNFYKSYSFNSGVQDFYGNPASGYIYEYTTTENEKGEDWFTISNSLVNDLLDTGNLYDNGSYRLITSGVGLEFANEDAIDFNLYPESGGRVYVFEKEFGDWSLTQEIKSPVSSASRLPERFGHSVSISEDAKTFAIGSPFIRESCHIYEYAGDSERNRLYDNIGRWLSFRNDATVTLGQYYNQLTRYEELAQASGSNEAGRQIYSELSTTNKFKARSDYDFWGSNHIKEYKQVFKYGLDDIERGLTGTFTKTMRANAPNPRLGYSSAVSEDGRVVAFGAPTDSLGQYEDAGFYFLHQDGEYLSESGEPDFPRNLWASNVNAGSVRIFEKDQDFEPIAERTVLEYNKFGNLSNTINNTEGYDDEGNETNSTAISQNYNYDKTDFADISIPTDVGSIFIITPEIDAANDEVIEEIKKWMSLGDRRLVLVGDDPIWEKNGAYARSNEIINKILEKLDSRMRLHPARNKREALIENTFYSGDEVAPNVIKSYTPAGSNSTNVSIDQHLFGYGVADIRLHVPDAIFKEDNWGKDHAVINNKRYSNCSFYNPLCGPPIAHNGDLRARWTERELKFPVDPEAKDPYTYWERNLPFEFYSNGLPPVKPKDAVDIAKDISLGGQGEQPRPLMVAAEFSENYATIPAIPERKIIVPITEQVCYTTNSSNTYYLFGDQHVDELAFYWTEESGNFNFVDTNIGNNFSEGTFYNPEEFNGRNALLQADGTLDIQVTREELTEYFAVDDAVNYVAKERVTNSDVYLIAGTQTETRAALQSGNDENISFYDNLVRNANSDNAFIIQLGGWTGRNTFAEAGEGSLLKSVFNALGHDLVEGWDGPAIPASKDVVWIANADAEPTQADIDKLVTWLSHGNKKLVITYGKEQEQSAKAYRLCEKLGLAMKPWYLPGANKFPTTRETLYVGRRLPDVLLNSNDQSIASPNGLFEVNDFVLSGAEYCPIDLTSGGQAVVWYDGEVKDERLQVTEEYEDVWSMNTGVAKVQFPAIPGSGYRIFYNWIADKPEEKQEIDLYVGDVLHKITQNTRAGNPQTLSVGAGVPIRDYDADRDLKIVDYASTQRIRLEAPSFGTAISRGHIDVQVPHNKDFINIFLTGNRERVNVSGNRVPTTYKFLSVSGALLPINEVTQVFTSQECETVEVGYEEVLVQEYVPPRTILLPATIKPIMNDNTRYCFGGDACGGKLVADGPVVIAEEPEHFSDGAVGNSRSKILLIADSTIVNGYLGDSEQTTTVSGVPTISKNTMLARVNSFLDSLTTTETTLVGTKTSLNVGYRYSEKIMSPEKGSPAIYSLEGSGMGYRFGGFAGGTLPQFGDERNYSKGKMVQEVHEKIDEFEEAEKAVLAEFDGSVSTFSNPRFSYQINGKLYQDPPMSGDPFSELLKDTGKDFLDYSFQSGSYPGDLFGHSLDIHNGKLIVGAPYSAYKTTEFSNISGISDLGNVTEIGKEGGGGSAYVFEKTVQFGWNPTNKLKPAEVRSFDNSDRFGWSTSMDADFAAISAPGHDFGNSIVYNKGAFVRKEFNAAFDIGSRVVTSLGSGESPASNNTGAVFTFENRLTDWSNRSKDWTFAEKLVPHGYASGEDTSSFGHSVAISRFARRDSDYALAVGSYDHGYGVDSGVPQESGAGATYTYDAMLREQTPATFDGNAWLKASVFGLDRQLNHVDIEVTDENVIVKGLVYSDGKGQIFIEASGQDPRELGFIVQRPYIERVEGEIVHGEVSYQFMNLNSYTDPFDLSNNVNLFILGQESDIVYNTLELSTGSAYFAGVSGVSLLVQANAPQSLDTSGLTLYTTASGISGTSLDLRVRGK